MTPDERPRERLKLRGPQALSDGDLLAIILNTGGSSERVGVEPVILRLTADDLLALAADSRRDA